VPLIPGLREVFARASGEAAWRHIRPPNLPLNAEQAQQGWDAMMATGALPLPGIGMTVAAE